MIIGRTYEFSAAHHLPDHDGKCKGVHGHNYKLEVEVWGDVKTSGPKTGMVMDFADLDKLVNTVIMQVVDHKDLNEVLDVDRQPPTAENLVMFFAMTIDAALPEGVAPNRLKLWETSRSYAEWRLE